MTSSASEGILGFASRQGAGAALWRRAARILPPRPLLSRLAAVLALCALAAWVGSAPVHAGEEKTILRICAWSDFFDLQVLADFEERYDCVVAIDTFDSNEAMLEDIQDGSGEPYDIVTPSSYMSSEMHRLGLLRSLDHALIPNLANLDAAFLAALPDPEMRYSVPYTRTVTGIGFNRQALGNLGKTWSVFGRRELAGRMTMLDDVRESMGAALKHLGYSLNTTDANELARAGDLLLDWRRNLAKFEVDEGNIGLGSGEYLAVHGYNGDLALLMEENDDIDFFVPEEGSAISVDDLVIMDVSGNRELAHRFINHLLDIDNAAMNMEGIRYYMPVPAAIAKLGPDLRENHAFAVPAETLDNCEQIRDLGTANELYLQEWARVKAGE